MEDYIMMYMPHCQLPQNIKLSDSIEYVKHGWSVDPSHQRIFTAYKKKIEEQAVKAQKTKALTNKAKTTRTTKSNPTSTTKKTVSRTTNKKGETVIKVNKTITIKKK